ncbi:MAG: dephospho-CoA kinase, partial [Pseudomonadota bacterium]
MHHIPDTAPQPDNEPWIVGVTGSIGGGKSTFARALCTQNADIQAFHIDADQLVHDGLKSGGAAVHRVLAAFPCASDGIGGIDRTKLANLVFQDLQADDLQTDDLQADELQASDPQALRRLESILHPIVSEMREQLIKQNRDRSFIVLDVPLLFETETWRRCDLTILVTTDEAVRARRTLARPGMTMARLQAILARQMPDSHKA